MPSPKTQRYIGAIGILGVLTSCFGCALIVNNQVLAAQTFLILAWLILVPLFGYLLVAYRRARVQQQRLARRQEARRQQELEAVAKLGGRGPRTRVRAGKSSTRQTGGGK